MYAASGRYLGQRAALGLLIAGLAGCAGGSSDAPAVSPPSTPSGTVAAGPLGPAVTFSGELPKVAGQPAATAALDRVGAGVSAGCVPALERSDQHLVSVVWRCGHHDAAATSTLQGRILQLGDILTGSYRSYLSSIAAAQFQAQGVTDASTSDLSTWYLTPAALAVVYPAAVVSYPLSSLGPYLQNASSL